MTVTFSTVDFQSHPDHCNPTALRRVVHRDLKLENLLLATPADISRVKIADFGLAKKLGGGGGSAGMQTICGTPQVRVRRVGQTQRI